MKKQKRPRCPHCHEVQPSSEAEGRCYFCDRSLKVSADMPTPQERGRTPWPCYYCGKTLLDGATMSHPVPAQIDLPFAQHNEVEEFELLPNRCPHCHALQPAMVDADDRQRSETD